MDRRNWFGRMVVVLALLGASLVGVVAGASPVVAAASLTGGTVKCWGSNASGQLGDGSRSLGASSSTPVLVFDLSGVAQLPDTVSLFPGRLLDSRIGGTTADGLFAGIGLRLAGGILQLDVAGDKVANRVVAKVDSSGKECIYTDGSTNLNADVESYYPNMTQFLPMAMHSSLDLWGEMFLQTRL